MLTTPVSLRIIRSLRCRGIAQSGSASALGAEGRGFESLCPDHYEDPGLTGTLCARSSTG